jgi:hypothetical protein
LQIERTSRSSVAPSPLNKPGRPPSLRSTCRATSRGPRYSAACKDHKRETGDGVGLGWRQANSAAKGRGRMCAVQQHISQGAAQALPPQLPPPLPRARFSTRAADRRKSGQHKTQQTAAKRRPPIQGRRPPPPAAPPPPSCPPEPAAGTSAARSGRPPATRPRRRRGPTAARLTASRGCLHGRMRAQVDLWTSTRE